jgi:hypothetical protein
MICLRTQNRTDIDFSYTSALTRAETSQRHVGFISLLLRDEVTGIQGSSEGGGGVTFLTEVVFCHKITCHNITVWTD